MKNKKIRLLIDFNHLAIRTLYVTNTDWEREGFDYHKHLVINTIFANIKKFNADEVILAVDAYKTNWRKNFYSEYKANRKIQRDASDFPWKAYFKHIGEFLDSMKELPFKILQVPYCEADDTIAVLSKFFINSTNVIVTSDSDYKQLLLYKQNKLYCPLKKKWVVDNNPRKTLQIKYLMGDKKDNVPAIRPRIGEKTAIKLIDSGEVDNLLEDKELLKNYKRNETLLSFDCIPKVVQKKIIDDYKEYKSSRHITDYFNWFASHNLRQFQEEYQKYFGILQKLDGPKENKPKTGLMEIWG